MVNSNLVVAAGQRASVTFSWVVTRNTDCQRDINCSLTQLAKRNLSLENFWYSLSMTIDVGLSSSSRWIHHKGRISQVAVKLSSSFVDQCEFQCMQGTALSWPCHLICSKLDRQNLFAYPKVKLCFWAWVKGTEPSILCTFLKEGDLFRLTSTGDFRDADDSLHFSARQRYTPTRMEDLHNTNAREAWRLSFLRTMNVIRADAESQDHRFVGTTKREAARLRLWILEPEIP
ncbi:hypothetical protein BKA93DRAFT_750575 [Sparassis latifolia]